MVTGTCGSMDLHGCGIAGGRLTQALGQPNSTMLWAVWWYGFVDDRCRVHGVM